MTDKPQNPSTVPKRYWAILSCLLYNKKIPAIPSLLADGKFVSDFCEKANFLNIFFHQYLHQYKMQVFYHLFYIRQMPE